MANENKQRLGFEGKMSPDVDPTKIKEGEYVDGKNIQFLTDNTQSTLSHRPMIGNTFAFDLGSVSVQNKIWRITSFDSPTHQWGAIYLYDQNGNLFPTIGGQAQPMVWDMQATLSAQVTAILAMFTTIDGAGTTSVTNPFGTNYIVIATNTITGYDIGLAATTTGGRLVITGITSGVMLVGETITGGTSGATGVIVAIGSGNSSLTLTGVVGTFSVGGENITGSTSGAIWVTSAGINTTALTTDTSLDPEVTQEAYDTTLSGILNDIGSNDLLGDLMLLSTPQTNLPTVITPTITTVTIVSAGAPTNNEYHITTSLAHGLSTGMSVVISGVNITTPGVTSPNGIWIITVTSATEFNLQEWYDATTGFVQGAAGGAITLYTEGVGEIGVAQLNLNTNSWTYTRLLRTKEWNFRTKYQADFRVSERTAIKDSHYWTDNYNVPRAFYYNHPYVTDGAIQQIDPSGHYSYLTVGAETSLLQNDGNANIQWINQLQAGGQIACGNWRYAYHFLSDSLIPTDDSDLTNPVNVYNAADNGNPALIIGDVAGTITSKINVLQITGIVPGLFEYVELIGVNYVGDAIQAFLIKRVLLNSSATTITIDHTGTETGITSYDLGLLDKRTLALETAKSMNVIDKRMILSNITLEQITDFTSVAQAITYQVERESLTSVGGNIQGTLKLGEYQDPFNVNRYVSLMLNETYRCGVKFKMKSTGSWTPVFFVDDITVNTLHGANSNNSTYSTGLRKLSGIANLDLTDNPGSGASPTITYSFYIQYNVTNLILNTLVGGVPLNQLVEAMSFERVEVNPTLGNATILANGMLALSCQYFIEDTSIMTDSYQTVAAPNSGIGEWGGITGLPSNGATLYSDGTNVFGADRKVAAFYSPDILFNETAINFEAGDAILNFGNPFIAALNSETPSNGSWLDNAYAQWTGNTQDTSSHHPVSVPISSAVLCLSGTTTTLNSSKVYRKACGRYDVNNNRYSVSNIADSMVIETTTNLNLISGTGQADYGFYYGQYQRALTNQYGDPTISTYISCGHYLIVTPESLPSVESVFGGDTFTQLNYFRNRDVAQIGQSTNIFPYIDWTTAMAGSIPGTGSTAPVPQTSVILGFGGGVSFYTQNRVNAQMTFPPIGSSGQYPHISTQFWLERTGSDNTEYNSGYTIRNGVVSDVAFNPNLEDDNVLPATIMWSAIKVEDSQQDNYRVFLPGQRHDLTMTDGAIIHHVRVNSELITWQERAFMRQYFNTRGTLQVQDITEILIGDGSVMSRDGVTLSRFGSSNKWAIIHGSTPNGDDVYMWISTQLKCVCHYSSNGTLTISDEWMKSFFANNLTWVIGKDTPAADEGICGVYDQRFNNFLFTVRGKNDTINNYDEDVTYAINNVIFYQPNINYTFLQYNNLTGTFSEGETITGGTSMATATCISDNALTGVSVTPLSGTFLVGEVITGGSSGATATITEITVVAANPFNVIGDAYVSLSNANTNHQPDISPTWWTKAPMGKYSNQYTIVFAGFKTGIICTTSPLPKIYDQWQNTYLSPRPFGNVSKHYLSNTGVECTWYSDGGISQTEQAYIEGVVNMLPELTKWAVAVAIDCEVSPDSMNFTTKTQISYLESSDFEMYEESYFSPVKGDSTITATNPLGLNDLDTSLLYSKWILVRFNFAVGKYQKLSNIIFKFQISPMLK